MYIKQKHHANETILTERLAINFSKYTALISLTVNKAKNPGVTKYDIELK